MSSQADATVAVAATVAPAVTGDVESGEIRIVESKSRMEQVITYVNVYTIVHLVVYLVLYFTIDSTDIEVIMMVVDDRNRNFQAWRWYTYSLAHGNTIHITMNVLAMAIYGFIVESLNSELFASERIVGRQHDCKRNRNLHLPRVQQHLARVPPGWRYHGRARGVGVLSFSTVRPSVDPRAPCALLGAVGPGGGRRCEHRQPVGQHAPLIIHPRNIFYSEPSSH